ncbi:hypothetical protein Raf01_80200 [Rugosimonospora africana]|uniref:Uncharacterized protein n=1 Tax=Rugosimonospora africana TaxID=556532 RepID=A0A8J3QZN4_9ACTN|nr:hypothetical protein Raf01_80200 [Rugosimonospora africana]
MVSIPRTPPAPAAYRRDGVNLSRQASSNKGAGGWVGRESATSTPVDHRVVDGAHKAHEQILLPPAGAIPGLDPPLGDIRMWTGRSVRSRASTDGTASGQACRRGPKPRVG